MVLIPDKIWFPWGEHPSRTSPTGKPNARTIVQINHSLWVEDLFHDIIPPIDQLGNLPGTVLVCQYISVCVISVPEYGIEVP